MILLASDLDNTLVFSPRRDIKGEKKCVEIYKNEENSYMTIKSIEILKKLQKKLTFIPITTRSSIGFSRIDFSCIGIPKYALTCNGGVLLVDGKVDDEWYNYSLELVKDSNNTLDKAVKILKMDLNLSLDIRKVENLFVFTKSNDPEKTVQMLKDNLDENLVDILTQGVKIYIMPKVLNKGMGVSRLKDKFRPEKIFTAGDTVFDIPMLRMGDIGYYPEELKGDFSDISDKNICIYKKQGDFSDVMLMGVWGELRD